MQQADGFRQVSLHFAVPADKDQWARRMMAACEALERTLPDSKLVRARSGKDAVPDQDVADVASFFEHALKASGRWFSLHNGKNLYIRRGSAGEMMDEGQVTIGGRIDDLSRRVYSLTVTFGIDRAASAELVLSSVGDAVDALNGYFTPPRSEAVLRAVQILGRFPEDAILATHVVEPAKIREIASALNALPQLGSLAYGATLDSSAQPQVLGWLNYWSKTTCLYLGFPEQQRDRDLLAISYKTGKDAWLVKLAADPLDITNVDHLSILARIYQRFPAIGIRA